MRRTAAGLALSAGLLGAVLLAGCGGSSGSGSDVPAGDVAVVDGQNISIADLNTTMNIAQALAQVVVPGAGHGQLGLASHRARWSRSPTTPSCAPGRATWA